MAEETAALMQLRAKAVGGKPGTPHVLALWDAVGIAHELNGFRNDAAGWVARYSHELEFPLDTLANYDALKAALEWQASTAADSRIARVRGLPDPLEAR